MKNSLHQLWRVAPAIIWLLFNLSQFSSAAVDSLQPNKPIPGGGISLLGEKPMAALKLAGARDAGSMTEVTAQGVPFSRALRLQTIKRVKNDYEIEVIGTCIDAVKKGDVILATLFVRSVKGQPETGESQTTLDLQTDGPDWSKSASVAISIPAKWKRIDIPFTVRYDRPAGQSMVCLRMGYNPQTFDIGGLSVLNFGDRVKISDLPRVSSTYAGEEPNAAWRKAALARIDKIRKGDMLLMVLNSNGKPVSGATVSIKMQKHAFGFGTAINASLLTEESPDAEKYRLMIKELYNTVSIENHLKWPMWEASWGRPVADKAIVWLQKNNIDIRGHNIIWPGWTCLPADLEGLKDDKAALVKRIDDHIAQIVPVYRGKLIEWDVVNEPYTQHDVLDILGKSAMIDWYKLTRKYDPDVRLVLNDYPPLDGGDKSNEHLNDFYNNIKYLQGNGAPLGAIGFQCHFGGSVIPPERILSGLDRFSKFGLPITITEFDMNTQDQELQTKYMSDFLTAAFSHPSVESVVMWGFWEGAHWMPDAALYRTDWSIKPHGKVWLDLVTKAWWTNVSGKTNKSGSFGGRAFYGDYLITVTSGGVSKKITTVFHKGQNKPVLIRLN